jgi:hypothetical protein
MMRLVRMREQVHHRHDGGTNSISRTMLAEQRHDISTA